MMNDIIIIIIIMKITVMIRNALTVDWRSVDRSGRASGYTNQL